MRIESTSGTITSIDDTGLPSLSIDETEIALPPDALILPGFVDTHCHLMGAGEMAARVDLRGASSAEECARRMAVRAAESPAGVWILGFGWNQEEWNDLAEPEKRILDRYLPDHPAALYRIDTHAAWVNSPALSVASITPREIEGGAIELAADGQPSGILIDSAIRLVENAMPAPTDDDRIRWIEQGAAAALSHGLTAVHDMNVEPERLPAMIAAANRDLLGLRVHIFLTGAQERWRECGPPREIAPGVTLDGVKFFADGALGSRGAWLLEPYSDEPETRGIELMTAEELIDAAAPAIEIGYAIATHAIGDAAVRNVIDAYEVLAARYPEALLRMEHAQIVSLDDVARMARIGVIAAVQPTHCISDAVMALRRLGPERAADAYRWRSLVDAGITIIAGSDFPVESPSVLDGLRAFVDRDPGKGAWYGAERISPEEALDSFTSAALTGVTFGRRSGRLRVGFDADLTVVEGDPFAAGARVVLTVVGGKVVFDARG